MNADGSEEYCCIGVLAEHVLGLEDEIMDLGRVHIIY